MHPLLTMHISELEEQEINRMALQAIELKEDCENLAKVLKELKDGDIPKDDSTNKMIKDLLHKILNSLKAEGEEIKEVQKDEVVREKSD